MDIRFCYRVSAEAGMAHNTETGEQVDTFAEFKLCEVEREPDDYEAMHRSLGYRLARQMEIDSQHITPISQSEYDTEMGDDEDES
ncbi:hypothetical protein ACIFQM_01120 [Paenibacillus sp. NRS-1782]|uniref:hypothetical protein n=1 Tax=unclassified Paenibacillus TaxID=185978 RepID=UPI003D2D089B